MLHAFLQRVAYTRTDIGPATMCLSVCGPKVHERKKDGPVFAVAILVSNSLFLASMSSRIACLLTGHMYCPAGAHCTSYQVHFFFVVDKSDFLSKLINASSDSDKTILKSDLWI
jgi:hypothetical protein